MSSSLSGTELLEIQKEMKNTCDEFFQELENAQLITDTPIGEFDPKKYLTWLNRDDSIIGTGKLELVSHMESIINEKFSEEDFLKFLIVLSVYQFTIRIEQLKDIFLDCLDLEKLKLRSNEPTLGDIIWKINDRLYPLEQISTDKQDEVKKIRKGHEDLFFLEFRNAVIHRAYVIGSTRITYLDKDNQDIKLSSKDFARMIEQFDYLRQYIYDYRNKLQKLQE